MPTTAPAATVHHTHVLRLPTHEPIQLVDITAPSPPSSDRLACKRPGAGLFATHHCRRSHSGRRAAAARRSAPVSESPGSFRRRLRPQRFPRTHPAHASGRTPQRACPLLAAVAGQQRKRASGRRPAAARRVAAPVPGRTGRTPPAARATGAGDGPSRTRGSRLGAAAAQVAAALRSGRRGLPRRAPGRRPVCPAVQSLTAHYVSCVHYMYITCTYCAGEPPCRAAVDPDRDGRPLPASSPPSPRKAAFYAQNCAATYVRETCGVLEAPPAPSMPALPGFARQMGRPCSHARLECSALPSLSGQLALLDEPEIVVRRVERVDWAVDRPRRGRPPRWLVALRARQDAA